MKRIIVTVSVLAIAVALLQGMRPAEAQQAPDDGTAPIVVRRGGADAITRVLREAVDPDSGRPARAGGIIVRFQPGLGVAQQAQITRLVGALDSERLNLPDTFSLRVPEPAVAPVLQVLRRMPEVASAEADLLARSTDTPNDPCFATVPNPCSGSTSQWGMAKIHAPAAWNTTTGSTVVRIAVLDCGVYEPGSSTYLAPDGQVGHPDLRDGKVVERVNFTSSTYGSDDLCNHGTHVAGIASANTGNGLGVAGVAYNTRLVNVKVLGDNGSGSSTAIINGILWTAGCDRTPCGARRAEVINMSLGGSGSCPLSVQSAINQAWNQGVVVVAAAGNSNTSSAFWPASCNNVLAVSASDSSDGRASFSNYGTWVDVAAPGTSILSLNDTGTYSVFNGTSMATPHVAGLAGLVWATSYATSPSAVVSRITSTADSGALAGSRYGRIDAAAAVGGTVTPAPDFSVTCSPSALAATAGSSSQTSCTLTSTGGFADTVTMGCSGLSAGVTCSFTPGTASVSAGGTASIALTVSVPANAGAQTLSFSVTATSGNVRSVAMTLNITQPPLPPGGGPHFLFSPSGSATVGGVSAASGDVLRYDGTAYSMYFDGSDVGVTRRITALARLSPTQLLMSFSSGASLPGVGIVDDSDIVLFTAISWGAQTTGTFSLYVDGSDIGLSSSSEGIDAISVLPDGTLLLSTNGSFSIAGLSGNDEDIFACSVPTLGSSSRCGSVSIYLDGGDLGFGSSSEDIDGLTVVGGDLYLSTSGSFDAGGVSGTASDIIRCTGFTPGLSSSCGSIDVALRASDYGLAGVGIAALAWES